MFNLEQALADWRRKLNDAGVKAPVVPDELESHLRDEIDAQLRLGLDEQQAFETAVERIGPVETLGRELTREQRLKNALLLAGLGLYSLVGGVPALFKLGSFSDISSAQQRSALAAVAVTAVALFGGRIFGRILPVVSNLRIRVCVYGLGVMSLFIWLATFYHHIMTRVEWDMSQLVVAILWAWMPMAALCGVILGMEEAAAARTQKTHV